MIGACERRTGFSLKAMAWNRMHAALPTLSFNYDSVNLIYMCQHDYATAPVHLVSMTSFEPFEFLIGH